ncbi:hypothetical protein KC660_00585 [Candidatus Dojkabacteria bacterium]|uniref:Uncharacterized protein n=1 Tax=Candidatus Dojkabacteria bacterium TaxID=2099670 RepID=A0A955L2X2_9BACT|nr:hypothetical protein [Candidatus Dojkabacteria bacterium]
MRTRLFTNVSSLEDTYVLGSDLRLEKIKTDIVEEDLQTLLDNADAITSQRGGSGADDGWPYKYSLEDNLKDVAWLEICTRHQQLASYVIRNEANRYVGCIYVYPIELHYAYKAQEYNIDFSFWITQQDYDAGLYEGIYEGLLNWMATDLKIDLNRVFLRNPETPDTIREKVRG